jgi:ABC-type branched-subunit amino acid transport system substrate-binding protein
MPGSSRGRESIRLALVAVVAAGIAVGVVEATKGSSGSSHASTAAARSPQAATGAGTSSVPAGRTLPGRAAAGKGAAASANARVAVSPAVERSLRRGEIAVVLDTPAGGPLREQNDAIAKGAAVAVDEINGQGGLDRHVHVKLLTQTLDGLSASALKARLTADAAGALILPCDTSSQAPLAAAGAQIGLLMLAPCNSEASASERYPTYWPVGMSTEDEADGLATYLASDNYRRLFVVAVNGSGYGERITAAVRTAARSHGISVVGGTSVPVSGQSFGGVVQALESVHPLPAALFTALPPPLVNRLGAALRSAGLGTTVFGGTVMDTRLSLTAGANDLENATFASYGFLREDPAAVHFSSEYHSDYGRPPVGSFPGLGFETIRLLSTAAAKAHSANPAAIQRALAGGLTLTGIALADRSYRPGSDHNPVGEIAGISKVSYGSIIALLAVNPSP